jgi:hypothetical protein
MKKKTKQSHRKPRRIIENAMDFQYKNLEIVPIEIWISLIKTPRFRDGKPYTYIHICIDILYSTQLCMIIS